MKKTLFWSICLFFATNSSAQTFDYQQIRNQQPDHVEMRNGEIFIVDSVLCFQYDEASADVVPQLREYALATNDQGEVTERLTEFWDTATNTYRNRQLTLRSFNSNGKSIEEIVQVANNGATDFTNSTRVRFIRNVADQPIEVVREVWNGSWELVTRELYEYMSNVRPTLFTFQDNVNGEWVNNFRAFTNYNTDGDIASTLFQTWTNSSWLNGNRTFQTYNDAGQLILINREVWSVSDMDWRTSSREIQVYQFGRNSETRQELYQDFDETWLLQTRTLKSYDEAGNLFQLTSQTYLNGEWVNIFNQLSIYDENGNLSRSVGELWVDGAWRTQNSCDFFYSLFVTGVRDLFVEQLACTFANPLQSEATFSCSGLAKMEQAAVRVYNLQGQLVYQQDITKLDYFNINHKLPFGVYQVVIQTNQGIVFSQKVVVTEN